MVIAPLIALIGFIFLVLVLYFIVLCNSVWGGEDFASDSKALGIVAEVSRSQNKPEAVFYDLGSCRGNFAIKVARKFPLFKIFGIDDSRFLTSFAQGQSLFMSNAHFVYQDIFAADISHADIVYIYLPQELMQKMEQKLKTDLKPGSVVITNKVNLPTWQPSKIFAANLKNPLVDKLFVYINF